MAISIGLISSGLSLITAVLNRVWTQEDSNEKSSEEKHAYVKGFIAMFLEQHDMNLDDVDGFIGDIISILNKHKIFTKER